MSLRQNKTVTYITCMAVSFIFMMSTNVASAIYPLYRSQGILSTFQITEVFATYILGLLPSLLISSWICSRVGLRFTILLSLLFSFFGTAIMAAGGDFSSLLLGRIFQGLSVGLSAGNLAATLIEFHPQKNYHKAALATGLSMTIGGGASPILGAILAQYVYWPMVTPYIGILILLILVFPWVLYLPTENRAAVTIVMPRIPGSVWPHFKVSALAAFLAWTIPAMFLSVIPVVISRFLPAGNLIYPAIAAGLVLIVSGLTQIFIMPIRPESNLRGGFLVLIFSSLLLVFGEINDAPSAIVVSSVFGGVGHGMVFLGATRKLNAVVSEMQERSEILLSYNLAIYLGVGLPVLCVGVLSAIFSVSIAVSIFGGFVILLSCMQLIFLRLRSVAAASGIEDDDAG